MLYTFYWTTFSHALYLISLIPSKNSVKYIYLLSLSVIYNLELDIFILVRYPYNSKERIYINGLINPIQPIKNTISTKQIIITIGEIIRTIQLEIN